MRKLKTGTSRKEISRPEDAKRYTPPPATLVQLCTPNDLIAGSRTILPDHQARLESDERLWCVGNISLLKRKCVAIVGTRQPTENGRARARRLARELVAYDVVVVSGLARGVDAEALNAAMEAKGNVVAVIGTPIDRAYPADNKVMQERIYREHLLVSQFRAGLQATGTASDLAEATGAWRHGKRSAFPTSPHPRRRLRTNVQRGVTLTLHLVQKIGQVRPGSLTPEIPFGP
jgi:hypothetical protein